MEEPAIGSVRFIAQRNKSIDVDSDDFDGWVPADGTKYSATESGNGKVKVNRDFKDRFAKALYTFNRGKAAATSFTVPNLTGFYKFTD